MWSHYRRKDRSRCVGIVVAARSSSPQTWTLHPICRSVPKTKVGTTDGIFGFASQIWSALNVLHCAQESRSAQAKWKGSGSVARKLLEWGGKGRWRATDIKLPEGSLSLSLCLSPSQPLPLPATLKCLDPTNAIYSFYIWWHSFQMWTGVHAIAHSVRIIGQQEYAVHNK